MLENTLLSEMFRMIERRSNQNNHTSTLLYVRQTDWRQVGRFR